jgi:hypothetical protein
MIWLQMVHLFIEHTVRTLNTTLPETSFKDSASETQETPVAEPDACLRCSDGRTPERELR